MTRSEVTAVVIATSLIGVVLSLVAGFVGSTVDVATSVWVVAGLLGGAPGAIGSALGAVFIDISRGTLGWETPIRALSACVTAIVPFALRRLAVGDDVRLSSLRDFVALEFAVMVGVLGGVATLAWGGELLGTVPFLVAPRLFFPQVVGPLVAVALVFGVGTRRGIDLDIAKRASPILPLRGTYGGTAFIVTVLAWFGLGVVGSIGYRTFEIVATSSPKQFTDRGLGFLLQLDTPLFGPGARHLQIALGVAALSVLAAILVAERHRPDSRQEAIVLTRRDALITFAAAGAVAVGVVGAQRPLQPNDPGTLEDRDVQTMLAVAEVVLPSVVTVESGFVTTYFRRTGDDRARELKRALAELDRESRREFGRHFADLSVETRDEYLKDLAVDRVPSDPTGDTAARLRYYIVDALLYALYSSPKGSKLLGIENPTGYPGGYDDYQRKPE
ncbi:hypothetical protein C453_14236 [Haloferax elongans ATCC BAA-1513]|uniref:Uncharacterized protein n=1 Tax=Haloferax elongans ATCC BAA-1513 TaxID=1230453 RepID=M0HF68_HALEO|nr:gluconate 2-dehydrogenase subunit 3 family protein [Haloferax elongans]ELZ83171.1 hypothetical protein C453_14236 [Haloferax elongans ATCC BAA-1513]